MGQTFGARAVVPGLGVLLGAPSPNAGSVSPVIIANPGNGEFAFVGAGGGAATAAQATGYVAYATIDRDQPLASVLASRRGQGGWVNAIVCPSGLRGSGSSCRSAIDPAGAGLALIAPLTNMSGKLSRRGGAVDPFIVMDVMAAAAEKEAAGDTVIHLEVGQPSTPAPKGALAAAHAALDSDRIGYVAALGIPALRERIARHYREAYRTEVSPNA